MNYISSLMILSFWWQVLLHLDRQEIPKFNIMRRWTKEAVVYRADTEESDVGSDADQMRNFAAADPSSSAWPFSRG